MIILDNITYNWKYQSIVLNPSIWHLEAQSGLLNRFKVNHTSSRSTDIISIEPDTLGWFAWGPKSQHESKAPTFETQETIKKLVVIIKVVSWLFDAKQIVGVVLRVGSSFLLDPTLNMNPKPHLKKNVTKLTSMSYLRPVWSGKSQLSCSQRSCLHGLTSSDLGAVWIGP